MKAKQIGNGTNKDLKEKSWVEWQQLRYLSNEMLTVTATDPTLPIYANPILSNRFN